MKITVHEEEVLSNVEVLKHLQEIRRNRMQELRVRHSTLGAAKGSSIPENVAAAQNQTITYLERTTASEQNTESISQLLDDLMKYDLAPAELQMIVNLRPHNPAVLMPIVEECDDRFDGDDVAVSVPVHEPTSRAMGRDSPGPERGVQVHGTQLSCCVDRTSLPG